MAGTGATQIKIGSMLIELLLDATTLKRGAAAAEQVVKQTSEKVDQMGRQAAEGMQRVVTGAATAATSAARAATTGMAAAGTKAASETVRTVQTTAQAVTQAVTRAAQTAQVALNRMTSISKEQMDQALSQTSDRMRRFADSSNVVVTGALKALSLGATAAATAIVGFGASFEAQMAKVAALQGIAADRSDATFAALESKARQLGRDTLFTATQAAEALTLMAQAGMTAAESVAMADSALYLAGAGGISIAESTDLVIATMRQFGMTASDTTRIVDVLSKGVRTSLLGFSDLREALKYAGTAGAGFGMSLEETVGAVAMFRNIGLEGSLAGNAFKMTMLQASMATDQNREVLARYGLTLADVNPELHTFAEILRTTADANMSATDAAVVFGSRAGASFAQLAQQVRLGKIDLDAYTATLEDSAGQTAEMYGTMLTTVKARGLILISSLQEAALALYDTIKGPLAWFLDVATVATNSLSASFVRNAGAIRAAWEPVFLQLGYQVGYLGETGTSMAAQIVVRLGQVASALVALLPTLRLVAAAMAAIFITTKVQAFSLAVSQGATAMLALAKAATGAQLAASASSLAFGALGAAVAAVTLGLAAYERKVTDLEARAGAVVQRSNAEVLRAFTEDLIAANAAYEQRVNELRDLEARTTEDNAAAHAARRQELEKEVAVLGQRLDVLRKNVQGAQIAVKAEEDLTKIREAEQAALADQEAAAKDQLATLQAQLAAEREEMTSKALATDGTEASTKALKDNTEARLAAVEAIREELLAARLLLAESGLFEGISPAALVPPAALDRLGALQQAVDALVPPAELDRVAQLRDLLAQVLEAAARSGPEAADAFALLEEQVRVAMVAAQREAAAAAEEADGATRATERWAAAWGRVRGVVSAVGGALRDAAGWGREAASTAARWFSTLTGGQVDLSVGGLASVATAEGGGTGAAQAMADSAVAFARTLAAELPGVVRTLVDAVPDVLAAVVAALPVVLRSVVALVPRLIAGVTQALPQVFDALRASLPDLLRALARALPALLVTVAGEAPLLIAAVVRALPTLIEALVGALPDVILALAGSMPVLVEAIVRALPRIVWAILQALPAIVAALAQLVGRSLWALLSTVGDLLVDSIGTRVADLARILADAVVGAFRAAAGFIRDLFREAITLGRATTASFGDTPGPVLAGAGGMLARFAPGDVVVASRSLRGIADQVAAASASSAYRPPPMPAGAPARGRPAGDQVFAVDVRVGDEHVERLLIRASASGRAPTVARTFKASQGARTGVSTGAIRRI